jgi:Glycosyl hydrolases family 18
MLLSCLSRSARTWAVRLSAVGSAAALVSLGGSLGVNSAAQADADAHAKPLPAHVFSPYFEAYTTDSPAALSSASGANYLTLAFLQTASAGSCEVDWNGNPATPVAHSVYGSDIAAIRAAGGDVVPSFGGYAADTTDTEIADSCTSVPLIAKAYENVITTYGVTRLDMDVEANSLSSATHAAAIDRRNKAIALVEKWAARTDRVVQFVYTIPTFATGLTADGQALLANAVANHARIDIVNIMTFDYYDNQPHEMGNDSIAAAGALFNTLHGLYPNLPPKRLWGMVGLTNMVGIDDFGPAETFTEADATLVEHWAAAHGIGELSFWAIERDNDNNGACIGLQGQGSCSGVAQSTWDFSHIFEPFTRR